MEWKHTANGNTPALRRTAFAAVRCKCDPALGRFIQPDSIVPDPSNPQDLNRFSYVRNNPLRYTDPTGHRVCDDFDTVGGCYTAPGSPAGGTGGGGGGGSGGGGTGEYTPIPPPSSTPTVTPTTPPTVIPIVTSMILPLPTVISTGTAPPSFIKNYCGNISGLACLATFSQDVATLIDLVGVGLIEAPAVAAGCIEGGPLGCVIAEVGVIATWNVTLNNVETAASSVSLILTVADDFANNGGWGENSSTSLATWGGGLAPLTPSWDLAVDSYSSGYNHGIFNGVNTIWTDGLFR